MVLRLLRSLLPQSGKRSRSKSAVCTRHLRLTLECLESRQLLSSLGINFNVFPKIKGNDTYSYTSTTHVFQMNATAFQYFPSAITPPIAITGGQAKIDVLVNNLGNLIGPDGINIPLEIDGTVTVNSTTYTSPLLTGNILQFASQYNGTNPSEFQFRFQPTGGSLTQGTSPPFPTSTDIGLDMISDNGNTFTGSFAQSFQGNAKPTVVPTAPLPVSIYGYKFDDVKDTGVPPTVPTSGNEPERLDDRPHGNRLPWQLGVVVNGDHRQSQQRPAGRVLVHGFAAGHVHPYRGPADRLDADHRRHHDHADQRPSGRRLCGRGGHAALGRHPSGHVAAGLRQLPSHRHRDRHG